MPARTLWTRLESLLSRCSFCSCCCSGEPDIIHEGLFMKLACMLLGLPAPLLNTLNMLLTPCSVKHNHYARLPAPPIHAIHAASPEGLTAIIQARQAKGWDRWQG